MCIRVCVCVTKNICKCCKYFALTVNRVSFPLRDNIDTNKCLKATMETSGLLWNVYPSITNQYMYNLNFYNVFEYMLVCFSRICESLPVYKDFYFHT